MALFANRRMARHPRGSGHQAGWMKSLHLLCNNDSVHPLPVRMVPIGVVSHRKYRWVYVYACPHGRGTSSACDAREGWIIGYDGRPFRLWRGRQNGR